MAATELQLDRYKYVVQVVIGEQRGEGVKMACRCLWDSDTDNYAQDVFMNVSIICLPWGGGGVHWCSICCLTCMPPPRPALSFSPCRSRCSAWPPCMASISTDSAS